MRRAPSVIQRGFQTPTQPLALRSFATGKQQSQQQGKDDTYSAHTSEVPVTSTNQQTADTTSEVSNVENQHQPGRDHPSRGLAQHRGGRGLSRRRSHLDDIDSFFGNPLAPFAGGGFLSDPLHEMNRISNYMMRNFDRAFRDTLAPMEAMAAKYNFTPRADFYATKEGYTVEAELAGIPKEDFKVVVEGDMLVLRGEKKVEEGKENEKDYQHKESFHGSFVRMFQLPEDADASQVKANYKNGKLCVNIPKKEGAASNVKEVPIESTEA